MPQSPINDSGKTDPVLEEMEVPEYMYLTEEMECAYFPERRETLVIPYVPAGYKLGQKASDLLANSGFRRSGALNYLPICPKCRQCRSVRVIVDEFHPSRTHRKIIKKNSDLVQNLVEPKFNQEHYDLYLKYLSIRHKGSPMNDTTPETYQRDMLASTCDTKILEHRDKTGKVVIVSVTDFFNNGVSAHYTFYDPDRIKLSPGTFAILTQISLAKKLHLPYTYLGFWIKDIPNMAYKSNFKPMEVFDILKHSWLPLDSFV